MPALAHTRCLVFIPAGPNTVCEYLADTIESVNHHIGASNCVVAVMDDSRQNRFASLTHAFANVAVITAFDCREGTRSSTRGTLFTKQVHTLRRLMLQVRFDVLLRMDTDALMIGDAPHEDALVFLASHPDVGMVGAFKRRGDGSAKTEAMAAKGRLIAREMSLRHGFRDLAVMRRLRSLVRSAQKHGYSKGDMCTGGAFFMSPAAMSAIEAQGLFDLDALERSTVPEDALLALLCCAAGYRLSDLPEDCDVLAINWRGLPMPLEALAASNKKIVHPVKDDDPTVEPRVREYFRSRRVNSRR